MANAYPLRQAEINVTRAAMQAYYDMATQKTAENTGMSGRTVSLIQAAARQHLTVFNELTSPTTLHLAPDGSTVQPYAERIDLIARAKGHIQALQSTLQCLLTTGHSAAAERAVAESAYYDSRLERVGPEENRAHLEALRDGYRACCDLLTALEEAANA